MVAKSRLPHILIQTQHDMHSIQLGEIEQQHRDAETRLLIAIKSIEVIDENNHGPPHGEKTQPHFAAIAAAARCQRAQFIGTPRISFAGDAEQSLNPFFNITRICAAHRLDCGVSEWFPELAEMLAQPVANQPGAAIGGKNFAGISREHTDSLLRIRARKTAVFDKAEQ